MTEGALSHCFRDSEPGLVLAAGVLGSRTGPGPALEELLGWCGKRWANWTLHSLGCNACYGGAGAGDQRGVQAHMGAGNNFPGVVTLG